MLSKEDFVAIASRIFALYLLVLTMRSLGTALNLPEDAAMDVARWGMIFLLILLPLALAALLWFFPLTIALKLLPVLRDPRPPLTAARRDVEDTAVFILGLWVLAYALVDVVYWIVLFYHARDVVVETFGLTPQHYASIFSTAAQFLLGIWLVFGARGLIGILRRLREAGSPVHRD